MRVIFQHLSQTPDAVTRGRIAILTDWARRAKALSDLENQLKSNMNPNVAKIMAPKRILLMRSIAIDMEWPDLALFDELAEGFKIVGPVTRVRHFQIRHHAG